MWDGTGIGPGGLQKGRSIDRSAPEEPPPPEPSDPMSDQLDPVRQSLRDLERSFVAFDRGDRNRLYESRDGLVGLTQAVESAGQTDLVPLCEIANRLIGVLLMEGGCSEQRAVGVVRELLGHVEGTLRSRSEQGADAAPGGVFDVVNAEKLGEMLLRLGYITQEQLAQALHLQGGSGGRQVGQVLIAMNAIDERTLAAALESQRGNTRRAETRRAMGQSRGAHQPTSTPIPPLPGADGFSQRPTSIPMTGEGLPNIRLPEPSNGADRVLDLPDSGPTAPLPQVPPQPGAAHPHQGGPIPFPRQT